METFRKISVGERLPEDNVQVQVEYNGDYYRAYHNVSTWYNCNEGHMGQPIYPRYWFEKIESELESEKILPIENRIVYQNNWKDNFLEDNGCVQLDMIEGYHRALESAELQLSELKIKYDSIKGVADKRKENIELLTSNTNERFEKAIDFVIKKTNFSKDSKVLNELLKIACYGS